MNQKNSLLLTLFSLFIIFCLLTCNDRVPLSQSLEEEKTALLRSNEIQRIAHMTNDASLLASEISDTMLAIQEGQISIASNEEIKQRFESYFKQVKYISWDDITAPNIQIAEDGSLATVIVQKLFDAYGIDSLGQPQERNQILFAWTASYEKLKGKWKIYSNTSTSKPLTEQEVTSQVISKSELYAAIPEKDLIPEGVAHDQATGITYLSSTYKQKILAIHPNGTSFEFKKENEDDLWSTVGMEVDEIRKHLWVISSNAHAVLPMHKPEPETEWTSKIYQYQLPEGNLVAIHEAEIEGKYFFNDLCISQNGKVYLTESMQRKVYELNPENGSFRTLAIVDSNFIFPNGITISEEDKYLFIAHNQGIGRYNLEQNTYLNFDIPYGFHINRLDGLAYYKNTLIGNQSYRKRIMQFELNETQDAIVGQRILEANHPAFDQPSTGEIAGDHFIYLANAQMQSGFEGGKLRDESELEEVILLKVHLAHNY